MKRLVFIAGPMGVGKTTVGKALANRLDRCAFLDGDWCWDLHPFTVNDETKAMVQDNIAFLLNQFLACSSVETVVFCWVMHQRQIVDGLLRRLRPPFAFHLLALTCSPEALRARLMGDVGAGLRTADVIGRSLERLPLYDRIGATVVDTTSQSAEQTARWVQAWLDGEVS